jgi:aldose 1-epimerase
VRWANWRVRDRDDAGVVMTHRLHPQPGYPFTLDIEIAYRLADDGLSVTTTATNAGDEPCPYGSGAHPYLTLGRRVDEVVLRVPGRGDYDFREPRAIGDTVLDTCFSDLERDDDGLARVTLDDTVTLWVDAAYGFLMVFTGDPLPDVNRRALAVEPMTCPPNALQTGEHVVVVAPGGSHTGRWGIAHGR